MAYEDLSEIQIKILTYIKQELSVRGYPPSVREMCKATGLSSTSSVHAHLNTLEKKGYIVKGNNKMRAIEIVDVDNQYADLPKKEIVHLPVLGNVAAGSPILAVENVEDFVTEGQEVEVYVLNIDQENRKFGLALKDINNDPWKIASEEISVGDIINVEVLRIIESGAFVKVRESVEAYLPISELSEDRVLKVQNVVNEGDEIKVKVIEFSYKNRRMKVSKVEAEREPEEDNNPEHCEQGIHTLFHFLNTHFYSSRRC